MAVIGWDIGGVNTKTARVVDGRVVAADEQAFELQHAPDDLVRVLRTAAAGCGADEGDTHAVTMTAELSQMFRTKRDGVAFVLDAVEAAFVGADAQVFTVDGTFVSPRVARTEPLLVAAANWAATAAAVARELADAVLIDVGSTTTDVIPVVGSRPAAIGRTDPERLASGELVYTGAVRTPVEAIVFEVPFGRGVAGVSAEGFALAADVHVWRGDLDPEAYTVTPPDGRPTSREFAGERLARVVCGDREMLDDGSIDRIAAAIADAQVERIAAAVRRVSARHPQLGTAVVTGLGAFLAEAAARRAGLDVIHLADRYGPAGARSAPATSVALLLDEVLRGRR